MLCYLWLLGNKACVPVKREPGDFVSLQHGLENVCEVVKIAYANYYEGPARQSLLGLNEEPNLCV